MRAKARAVPGSALRRVLIGGTLALVVVFYLARAATEEAGASPTFFVDPSRVAVEEAPAWLPPEWVGEAETVLRGIEPFSVFDARGTEGAERALRSLGWVKAVEPAGRSFPRTARIRIRVRRPAAVVEGAGGGTLVDEAAVVLPSLAPERAALLPPLPRVVAPHGDLGTEPVAGADWKDRRVRAGVAVALEVRPLVRRAGPTRVVAIDVTNADGRADPLVSSIVLVTEAGARLLWGRPAAEGAFGELSTAAKLEALERVVGAYPRLAGVREADLRFDRPVVFADGARLAEAR
ncbi:MAG TPA: hypothetical protein VFI25_08820 [Planctomycetota bacterium]|jgi:hypothetical protein|nr:hypothetical protein [Planctomycetota bacterium]